MDEHSSSGSGPMEMSPLIDVAGITLEEISQLDDSILVRSLNRVLGDIRNPDDVVLASFSAII